ncbi:metal ABC transporter solute-binding protein, Zn/Mn family [Frigoribacterium sp. 2-23]|uniref:metal ABC transporter solute-binding protein, Zn/Mn family n=1 Tax=Frigoribacterium sp. 2-23 TaxID=3415006 RepID=UPI003C6F03FE
MTSRLPLRRLIPALGAAAALALVATGCSATGDSASGSGTDGGAIQVVASTNVYGDIASTVGGDAVTVTSIISDPSQDPHSYEGDARTQLAISRADVVIENGGGYDSFVDTMVKASDSKATVINAVDVSGLDTDADADDHDHATDAPSSDASAGSDASAEASSDASASADDHGGHAHDHGEFNEHVFYSLPSMAKLATAIADELGRIDSAKADTFSTNAKAFEAKIDDLESQTAAIKTAHDGTDVAYTEPVPGYLFDEMGLHNVTPSAFSEAIEEGDDVSPAALRDMLALASDKKIALLAYNEQTSSPETTQVQSAAEKSGVPIVPVTELLPSGDDYISWQQANIDSIKEALAK